MGRRKSSHAQILVSCTKSFRSCQMTTRLQCISTNATMTLVLWPTYLCSTKTVRYNSAPRKSCVLLIPKTNRCDNVVFCVITLCYLFLQLSVPPVHYSSIINLPTADFQKIIRDLSGLADSIEIKSIGKDLYFSVEGTFTTTVVKRSECENNMNFVTEPSQAEVVRGVFPSKCLFQFIKCTPLCPHLEMNLGNGLPLIIKYDVASLGTIKLCCSCL